MSIYGSRSIEIAEKACDGGVFEYVDESETVPVAEVVHVVRNEMAVTLVDIIHRRTMVGLLPDQGVGMAQRIARIAADELGWDKPEIARQLELLDHYNARLRPPTGIAQG